MSDAAAFDPAGIAADFDVPALTDSELLSLTRDIDLKDPLTATGYGAKEQRELGELSDNLLKRAFESTLEDAVSKIHALQEQISSLDIASLSPPKGFFRSLFSPAKRQYAALRRDYTEISYLMDRLADQIDLAGLALQKEKSLLDTLYDANRENHHALAKKILAGEQALKDFRQTDAKKKENEAFDDLFSGRLNQLRQSKTISLQLALQIRLTQHNLGQVIKKLRQIMDLALPLWRSQLALALNINDYQEALGEYRSTAGRTTAAMKQAQQALKEGSAGNDQENKAVLAELDRLREADQRLKQLMEEMVTLAGQAARMEDARG
ncbi:MAG: toxic anion resistance protein [Bacillota bacterium]|nr:toxic anion resistance protein [Bacillota bacterium]